MVNIPTGVSIQEIEELRSLARGKIVLEVGSLLGYSTVNLAQVAERVHAVDPHEGYPDHDPRPTLQPFIENLNKFGVRDRVKVHIGKAQDILPVFRYDYFDLGFIDVNGGYEDTLYCLKAVSYLVRPGGWLAVHDYGRVSPDCSGATRAVEEYEKIYKSNFVVDTTVFWSI